MPRIDCLSEEIRVLREQLHDLLVYNDHYHTKRIIALSSALDEKILEYMLLTAHEEQ